MSKTLTAIRALRHVAFVDDERHLGNSILVTLARGYVFKDDTSCGVKGFDTVRQARDGCRASEVMEIGSQQSSTPVDMLTTALNGPSI